PHTGRRLLSWAHAARHERLLRVGSNMGIENRKHRQHHSTLTLARGLALLCAGAMFAACGNSGTSVSTPTPAHTTSPSASSTPEPPTTPPPAVPQAAASLAAGTTS